MTDQPVFIVGRTPWSAADALVGPLGVDDVDVVGEERVQGDPHGPGGPPHNEANFQDRSRRPIGKSACRMKSCPTLLALVIAPLLVGQTTGDAVEAFHKGQYGQARQMLEK